jgi:membrane protein implicated in regulation of membrane protease activity
MWLVYAAALVLGGGILLIQLISGSDHDAGGVDHDLGGDHHPHEGPGLLSIRSLSYGTFAFGFVGGALHTLGLARPPAALGAGIASGAAAALLVGLVFRSLSDQTISGEASLEDAAGSLGRVLVPCGPGRAGKVRLTLKGQTVDVLAVTDAEEIAAGNDVVVIDVRDMVARVAAIAGGSIGDRNEGED